MPEKNKRKAVEATKRKLPTEPPKRLDRVHTRCHNTEYTHAAIGVEKSDRTLRFRGLTSGSSTHIHAYESISFHLHTITCPDVEVNSEDEYFE